MKEYKKIKLAKHKLKFIICNTDLQCVKRDTTKVRSVFDLFCSSHGPSLSECLYSRRNVSNKIFNILIRVRFNSIAILADAKQNGHSYDPYDGREGSNFILKFFDFLLKFLFSFQGLIFLTLKKSNIWL